MSLYENADNGKCTAAQWAIARACFLSTVLFNKKTFHLDFQKFILHYGCAALNDGVAFQDSRRRTY